MSETVNDLIRRGYQARREGRVAEARRCYGDAVEIYRQNNVDPLRLAHTVRHLADIHRGEGSFELASPLYEEALKIYRQHEEASALDVANAIRGFALLKSATGERDEATSLWLEARKLYESVDVHAGVEESNVQLARLGAM